MLVSRHRGGLAVTAAFLLLTLLPFLGKAFHMDEPFFLAIGRHILQDPLHPSAFSFNWYGQSVPMSTINNTPPVLGYLLAAAYIVTGGAEWAMRLCFLPFDLAAALSLYLLAARFLQKPLFPVLIVLAAPAYLINMNHLMAEKVMAAFAFPSLYALVRGVDEKDRRWYFASAVLFAAALMAKYNAVFLAGPAALYAWRGGVSFRRIAGYLAADASGLAAYFLFDLALRGGETASSVWNVTATASGMWWASWPHKLRSFLSFTGGCGLVTAIWPLFIKRNCAALAACAGLAALLFLPQLDLAPLVRPVDRWTGFFWSTGTLYGVWLLLSERSEGRGWALWASWTGSVALLLIFVYWSVMARLVLFLLPPLVFALAEILERTWKGRPRLEMLYGASLALVLALSVCLGAVDYRYAGAQKELAEDVARRYAGRTIWGSAHWGLQYYLEQAGARQLDWAQGGWEQVRPGDIVVVPRVNSNVLKPKKPLKVDVRELRLGTPIPLRLMSGWTGEGGFYTNSAGFLPYSLSAEPLEEFRVVEVLP